MRVPESWLRVFVDPPLSIEEIADRLTMAGLEVESVDPVAPPFSGVVVGAVLSVDPHPGADRLHICRVEAGGREVAIVCGAPNVRAGMKAPLALPGARLPDGREIARARLRGVESEGMLCSARELGLDDDHAGLLELASDAVAGADVHSVLALDDRVLEVKLTPNRADCLSIFGVAREVAALTGASLREPSITPVTAGCDARLPVRILAPDLCGRFSGRVIRRVDGRSATPGWMKQRLERAGQRPISALVDISNYVMLELGRPSHVFDLDRVDSGGIEVRWGRPGERVRLLNDQEVELAADVGVIADAGGVEALAGIMGGASTAVSDSTRNIYVEAAFWWPEAIAGRARRFNFTTDAGHRFERGVDFSTTVLHIEYLTRLIVEICGGEPGPVDDTVARLPSREPVTLRIDRARKVIGIPLEEDEVASVFKRLGLSHELDGGSFRVTPPAFRFDLAIEEDLIEEVARIHGFERIPSTPPAGILAPSIAPESLRSRHQLRERLVARDFQEVIAYSFVEPELEARLAGGLEPVRLLNPIASHLAVMRTGLLGGLLSNLRYNLARHADRVRTFELGRVYWKDRSVKDGPLEVGGIAQPTRIAALAYGPVDPAQWGRTARRADFFDLKADLESLCAPLELRVEAGFHPAFHPGRAASVSIAGVAAGWIGELHPRLQRDLELPLAPVLFEIDIAALERQALVSARVPSRFPAVVRDIAVAVDSGQSVQGILDAVRAEKQPLVVSVGMFDLYVGEGLPKGRKSVAFRVVMQDTERTLTDAEADVVRDSIVALMGKRFGAVLRT